MASCTCRPPAAGTQLLAWAEQWPQRRWSVEGASGLGRGIAQLLIGAGEQVVDVPAKLAARARLLSTSSARKSNLADACSVAAAAIHHRRLRPVAVEDKTVIFRLLSDRRDNLIAERTRTLSRLHVLLADLHPGGANRELSAARAATLLRRVHPITVVDVERKRIARGLLADVRRLDRQVKTASQAIRTAVREHGTTLTEVFGVGPVLAAKLVGHAGDITASRTATIRQLHRHRPGGGLQRRRPPASAEPGRFILSLKRHLANVVYSHLVTDHRVELPRVDTQRRYQVTSPDRWVPMCPAAAGRQLQLKASGR